MKKTPKVTVSPRITEAVMRQTSGRPDPDSATREADPASTRVVPSGMAAKAVTDLQTYGVNVDLSESYAETLIAERISAVTQIYDVVGRLAGDLTHFKPKVPEPLPGNLRGRFLNPDGSPAALIRVRALEPTSVATTSDGGVAQRLPWSNPETVTDARGAFRLALPRRPLPDDGLVLALTGSNRQLEHTIRRRDLIAGFGQLGVIALDDAVTPLPRSIISQLGDLVMPIDENDALEHPEDFGQIAPVITLGQGDCARAFRSNTGIIDRFSYSMLIRLTAPEPSRRRLAIRLRRADGSTYVVPATSGGYDEYLSPERLIALMGKAGSWEIASRSPIGAPIDVDDFLRTVQQNPAAVPKAASLGLGYVVTMHQVWVPTGLSLGDLLYSLPLAPGEQQRIAVVDERETLSVREQEALTEQEAQSYSERADSSTAAVFSSAYDEAASGGSSMRTHSSSGAIGGGLGIGGFFNGIVAGLGVAGGYADSTTTGSASSWQNTSRDYVSNASQGFHSSLDRAATARRSATRMSVRLATASERREVVTKVITNHNHNHALTMQYWEVLRHFGVTSQIDDVQLVCFVPFELIQFLPPGQSATLPAGNYSRSQLLTRYSALLAHHDVLATRLRHQPAHMHALRLLRSFAGDPTMQPAASGSGSQDIAAVRIDGTFLPFEDIYVTAVANNGARIGPIRLTGTSSEVDPEISTRAGLVAELRRRRRTEAFRSVRTCDIPLPRHLARSNLARFEFSRSFRPFNYTLSLPSNLDFNDLLSYFANVGQLNVTMNPADLEREVNGPLVWDPTITLNDSAQSDMVEAYHGIDGVAVMPVVMPVAAKRLLPVLEFADLLQIENLLQHVSESTVEYSKAVWQSLTPEERAILLERFTIGVPEGGVSDAADEVPLLDCVANQVLGYFGNAAVMPFFIPPALAARIGYTSRDFQEALLRFHRQAYRPAQSSITLPARGMLGEAVLGHCDSSEKIDLTRFWNWQDSPPDAAADIGSLGGLLDSKNSLVGETGATAPETLTRGGASMVNINQGPAAMTPPDLISALLQSRPDSTLPTDLTGLKELGAQMKVQTETTATTLDKTITEATGLAKEAIKQVPSALSAKAGAGSGQKPSGTSGSSSSPGSAGSTGSSGGSGGTTAPSSTTTPATGSPGSTAPIDGGPAPA